MRERTRSAAWLFLRRWSIRPADPPEDELAAMRETLERRIRDELALTSGDPDTAPTAELDALAQIQEVIDRRSQRSHLDGLQRFERAAGWTTFGLVVLVFLGAIVVLLASRGANRAAAAVATATLGALLWILRRVIGHATGASDDSDEHS